MKLNKNRKRKLPLRPINMMMQRPWTMILPLALLVAFTSALTYDYDVQEPTTRYTKILQKTHVAMDDLDLGALDPEEAAQQAMDRIGDNVGIFTREG